MEQNTYMHSPVTWEKHGTTAVVTIDNPPVNVLTDDVRLGIDVCMDRIAADDSVACVILTGNGTKAFMAGANIKGFPAMAGVPGAAYAYAKVIYDVWDKIEHFPKPTIAAINGLALGAGMELAAVCDLRIADESARFGFPEIKLGLFPGGGGTQRMPRLIGAALTKEMCFTGAFVDADRALQAGFLNAVTPQGESLNKALEIAQSIGNYSHTILSAAKTAINDGLCVSEREGIAIEADLWQQAFMTEDLKEGVDAFIHKRAPVFRHC